MQVVLPCNTAWTWIVELPHAQLDKCCVKFFQEYGPVVCDGFTFEGGGYTDTVDTGDGDFLTEDTLWDFKVSKSKPTNKHTLQLLMYWIMGQHTLREEFRRISKLGIFNPRLNTVYLYDLSNISLDVVKEVEREVICYWSH